MYCLSAQEWMAAHSLPHTVPTIDSLMPATSYVICPCVTTLENAASLSWRQQQELNVAFFVTREMLISIEAYLTALEVAGYATNEIGVDIDGKRKLVRNNWELITYGCRRLYEDRNCRRWRLTFTPFGTLLAPSESYEHHAYALLALTEACQRVLQRHIKFVAQNTDAHTSSLSLAAKWPLPVSTLCYSHVIRAPADKKQAHLLSGSKEAKEAFLEVVKEDIRHVHLCQTTKQAHRNSTRDTRHMPAVTLSVLHMMYISTA